MSASVHSFVPPVARGIAGGKVVVAMLLFSVAMASLVLLFRPDIGKPDEGNRTRHPAGFSIVAPLGWEREPLRLASETTGTLDTLKFAPERKVGKQPWLVVTRLGEKLPPENFAGFVDATFQGQPARVFDGKQRGMFHWHAIFQRHGQWYRIELFTPDPQPEGIAKTSWMAFFETFQADAPPATAPATAVTPESR